MILQRIFLNLKIFFHCLVVLYFYKFKPFSSCIQLIKFKENVIFGLSPNYLSKKINFFSEVLFQNNCFYKSMCLYSLLNNDEDIEFYIGVKKDNKNKIFSHSWIEFKGAPINENKLVRDFKPIFSLKK